MTKRSAIGIGLLLVAIVAMVLLVAPWFADDDTEEPSAPEFSAIAVIENARVVLPPVAGGAAAIYFDISNRGADTLYITEAEIGNGRGTSLSETDGPANLPMANLAIHPGTTERLSPGTGHVVLTGYGSELVPGAVAQMKLTFQNGQTVTVPAKVEASPANAVEPGETGAETQAPVPPT
jgi:copper(I)-binding protein